MLRPTSRKTFLAVRGSVTMSSPVVVSVAESKSSGTANRVSIVFVWVYGSAVPVSGLLHHAGRKRSWLRRRVTLPPVSYQRLTCWYSMPWSETANALSLLPQRIPASCGP
jgi:hypothetical protein